MNISEQVQTTDDNQTLNAVPCTRDPVDTASRTESTTSDNNQKPTGARNWPARLEISACANQGRTSISRARHEGPLRIQRPFYPEGTERPHLYLLHPPGGLVCGDHLKIDIDLEEQAKLLITTPSAGKIYRTDQQGHAQKQDINIECTNNAHIEWLPQENIIYDGANGEQNLTLSTTSDSSFLLWDITAMGRPATNAPFRRGCFIQKLNIVKNGLPYFHERVHLQDAGANFTSPWGLNHYPVYGSLFAGYIKDSQAALEALRDHLDSVISGSVPPALSAIEISRSPIQWSATRRDDLIILRALGQQSEPIKALFMEAWHLLRPQILGVDACPPRIWAT
ncbi:hypothetical protein BTA51_08830 [Hahella sp. CCB-MM4]|uniref:urease accessory protein UreD n=1 Tax=Hahella sp. (strain CCB-MM4) TaxID=1926491 RepID=UPI000B9B4BC5|nr:urease accessory protein UreD [Hahella sp. CCB-MM4]OZG73881.1 hypothetical protein BTA51_08830 [Hahella sp. CCB-MM4]